MIKSILLALITCFILTLTATAQQVTVDQTFVDDANTAFREVVVLRTANTALIGQVKAEQEAKDANALLAKSQAMFIDLLKADNADLRKLKCDSTSIFWVIKIRRCK